MTAAELTLEERALRKLGCGVVNGCDLLRRSRDVLGIVPRKLLNTPLTQAILSDGSDDGASPLFATDKLPSYLVAPARTTVQP